MLKDFLLDMIPKPFRRLRSKSAKAFQFVMVPKPAKLFRRVRYQDMPKPFCLLRYRNMSKPFRLLRCQNMPKPYNLLRQKKSAKPFRLLRYRKVPVDFCRLRNCALVLRFIVTIRLCLPNYQVQTIHFRLCAFKTYKNIFFLSRNHQKTVVNAVVTYNVQEMIRKSIMQIMSGNSVLC